MGLFKAKEHVSRTAAISASTDQMRENERGIYVLKEIVIEQEELVEKLQEVAELIRYSAPSEDERVLEMDKKIANKLEYLKMVFMKADASKNYTDLLSEIKNIKIMIFERNSKNV